MSDIAERLKHSYDRIIAPVMMFDVPITLENMAIYKKDKDGNETDEIEGYYSINTLSKALGKQFQPVLWIDERFAMFRWALDDELNEEGLTAKEAVKKLLEEKGLVNIRALNGNTQEKISLIDWENIPDNGYIICNDYELESVPKVVSQVPEDVA